ncbi:LuxR C-terminal-related transcriptional regulator [Streptosporangium sp. NPDC002544]|uniref:LuxR C-terminal-related transcriptional regulator n=1 Tax=Streptosporangium sp. NPDC002544 TaxID=3154538 RepID=UPI0033221DB6
MGSRLTAQEMVINHPKQANMGVITLAWPPLTALCAFGTGDREVARRFFITEATVKTHLMHIYGELGVAPRIAAVTADGPPWRLRSRCRHALSA